MAFAADPDVALSTRARPFLTVAYAHFALIGLTILLWPAMYADAAWTAVVSYTTLPPWGWAHLAVAAVCLAGVATHRPGVARVGLAAGFVVLMATGVAVGWGVAVSWVEWRRGLIPAPASPFIPVVCLALAVKDALVASWPLRDPPP